MTDTTEKPTFSTREFAHKFGFHSQEVQKACKSGEVKATKNEKGFWRIPEKEVKRFQRLVAKQKKLR